MNGQKILGIILIVVSLFILYSPQIKIPSVNPLPEEYKPLAVQVKANMIGENASNDAKNLSGCLRAAANQFTLDVTRPEPYYKDNESLKWAIKTIGDLSYPIGWKLEDRYPGLPGVLGDWLTNKLGDDFSRQDLVHELRGLALVFEQV